MLFLFNSLKKKENKLTGKEKTKRFYVNNFVKEERKKDLFKKRSKTIGRFEKGRERGRGEEERGDIEKGGVGRKGERGDRKRESAKSTMGTK